MYDLQGTLRNQQRCSTAKAYLEPANDRPNLDILTHAFVRKVFTNFTGDLLFVKLNFTYQFIAILFRVS